MKAGIEITSEAQHIINHKRQSARLETLRYPNFVLFSGLLPDTKDIRYLDESFEKYSEAIFNKGNTKRRSTPLEKESYTITKLIHFLITRSVYDPKFCIETEFVGIRSLHGCTEQPLHVDVNDQEACFRAKNYPCIPRSVIWCFDDSTKLNIRPPCDADVTHTIVMKKGDVLVFDGDLVHAGCAYDTVNTRVHFHIDSRDMTRP